jgi:hypothetical protein
MLARSLLVAVLALTSFQALPPGEKSTRTPAQQKISSLLLDEIQRVKNATLRGERPSVPSEGALVKVDQKQRALVDVRAAVTPDIRRQVIQAGGTIVSTWPDADSVIAWVPLLKLEQLAEGSSVRGIQPADQATHK